MFYCPNYSTITVSLAFFILTVPQVRLSPIGQIFGEHYKKIGGNDAAESLSEQNHKGEHVKAQESALSDNHNSQYSDAKDKGHYVKKDGDVQTKDDSGAYAGHNFKKDASLDSSGLEYKKGHKKGHHSEGFTNSYHKDETSNKSTFFDDLNDEGGQHVHSEKKNSFGNQDGRQYQGARRDGNNHERNNYNEGGYNMHGGVDNRRADHIDYGKQKYHDDRRDYNRYKKGHDHEDRGLQYRREQVEPIPHGGIYDAPVGGHGFDHGYKGIGHGAGGFDGIGGGYEDEGFGHGTGYGHGSDHSYEGYGGGQYGGDGGYGGFGGQGQDWWNEPRSYASNAGGESAHPPASHQRITIYEDPRYDGRRLARSDDSAHVQLDVRPSQQRYARYDSYYEPTRDGGVERQSEINRLVYNYRRH